MKLNKKIIVTAIIVLLATAGILWATRDNDVAPDGQSSNGTVDEATPIEPESNDEQESSDDLVEDEVVEEAPPTEVDDRGGYTPY